MSTRLRLGLHLQLSSHPTIPERRRFEDAAAQAVAAERLGFESVWPVEQHFDREASMLSAPLVFLAGVAARTSTIRLGTAILIAPLHHPLRLAGELATLDVLSGGRVECGLGRGIDPTHFARFDVPAHPGHAQLDTAICRLRAAWTDPAMGVTPAPLQQPHPPIRVAANTADTFVHAGRLGLPIMVATHINPPAVLRELICSYRRSRAEHGHDHRADDVTVLTPVFTHADPRRARELVEPGVERMAGAIRQRVQRLLASLPSDTGATAERARAERLAKQLDGFGYDVLVERDMAVFGTPAEAACRIHQLAAELTAGRVICWFDPGGLLAHDDIVSSMTAVADATGSRP
ncbi:MAG TPA: LLM class flavin-dependent oxidoreductase [Ilumatobacteraceae bacterium]|nr:LLM class flavin-dependent oxidoreductase [Ilumatobacteraceae bacterium]